MCVSVFVFVVRFVCLSSIVCNSMWNQKLFLIILSSIPFYGCVCMATKGNQKKKKIFFDGTKTFIAMFWVIVVNFYSGPNLVIFFQFVCLFVIITKIYVVIICVFAVLLFLVCTEFFFYSFKKKNSYFK